MVRLSKADPVKVEEMIVHSPGQMPAEHSHSGTLKEAAKWEGKIANCKPPSDEREPLPPIVASPIGPRSLS
jgi:hypothetical protein